MGILGGARSAARTSLPPSISTRSCCENDVGGARTVSLWAKRCVTARYFGKFMSQHHLLSIRVAYERRRKRHRSLLKHCPTCAFKPQLHSGIRYQPWHLNTIARRTCQLLIPHH
ncbi:hypothetical protein PSPO01_05578 [Paraphaeosphaeria sporulosa]